MNETILTVWLSVAGFAFLLCLLGGWHSLFGSAPDDSIPEGDPWRVKKLVQSMKEATTVTWQRDGRTGERHMELEEAVKLVIRTRLIGAGAFLFLGFTILVCSAVVIVRSLDVSSQHLGEPREVPRAAAPKDSKDSNSIISFPTSPSRP